MKQKVRIYKKKISGYFFTLEIESLRIVCEPTDGRIVLDCLKTCNAYVNSKILKKNIFKKNTNMNYQIENVFS